MDNETVPSGRYSFLPVKIIAFAAKISIIMRLYYYFGALANEMAIMSKDSCGPGHCPFDLDAFLITIR